MVLKKLFLIYRCVMQQKKKRKKRKHLKESNKNFQASLVEHSDGEGDYSELNEEVRNAKKTKDGIALVKKYEDLLKGGNKKIINIAGKQGELLKVLGMKMNILIMLG